MARLPQIPDSSSPEHSPCPKLLSRRDATRRVGSWIIYLGALSGAASVMNACGGPEVTDLGSGGVGGGTPTPTPVGTNSGTPTPAPTNTPNVACGCTTAPTTGWTDLGIKTSQVPLNAVAYDSANSLFLCHDANGFYVMTSVCTHQGCDIGNKGNGSMWSTTDVSGGFTCGCHMIHFDYNGVTQSSVGNLKHYKLTYDDATGELWAELSQTTIASCRC